LKFKRSLHPKMKRINSLGYSRTLLP